MIAQMTLRRIPDAVEKKLRAKSRHTGRSMNSTAIALLAEALGTKETDGKKRDLSQFAGKWNEAEYREFERHTQLFEQIDEEVWAP